MFRSHEWETLNSPVFRGVIIFLTSDIKTLGRERCLALSYRYLHKEFAPNLNEIEARARYISSRQFRGQLTIADDNNLSASRKNFPCIIPMRYSTTARAPPVLGAIVPEHLNQLNRC